MFGINMGDKADTSMVNIKVDLSDFEGKIQKIQKDMPNIGKKLMTSVFSEMRNDIRRNIKRNFKRHKGWLLKDLNYWAFNDFAGAIFTRNSKRQGVHYASVLEEGGTITPKNGKYLVIYGGKDAKGRIILKQVKSVTIPSRPFMKPVVDDYWGGGGFKAKKIMEAELQRQTDYIFRKNAGAFRSWKPGDNVRDLMRENGII